MIPASRLRCIGCCALLFCGCPEPTQYGGAIPVQHAGFASRMQQLCRLGKADDSMQKACAAQPAASEAPLHDFSVEQPQDADSAEQAEPAASASGPASVDSPEAYGPADRAQQRHQRLRSRE
jgi:hypothetical protein